MKNLTPCSIYLCVFSVFFQTGFDSIAISNVSFDYCNNASVEPPSSFGSAGPEAFYCVCSPENVNRFKNLVSFNESVQFCIILFLLIYFLSFS